MLFLAYFIQLLPIKSFILLDGTDSSSRDLGGFLTVTNGAGMAADLTLTADADASFTVS